MSDATQLPSKELFREVEPLKLDDGDVSVKVDNTGMYPYIVLRDPDPNGPSFLSVDDARSLRSWLDRVIPEDDLHNEIEAGGSRERGTSPNRSCGTAGQSGPASALHDWSLAPADATHYQPHQRAYYKRISATEWVVWSRLEREQLRWMESPGTSDSADWIKRPTHEPSALRQIGVKQRAPDGRTEYVWWETPPEGTPVYVSTDLPPAVTLVQAALAWHTALSSGTKEAEQVGRMRLEDACEQYLRSTSTKEV
jgi:hypothetical protein